jgi:hypothetical protein
MLNLKKDTYNLSYIVSNCGGTTTPLFIFFATQNIALIKIRWGKKNLIVVSPCATFYRDIMPKG